eukprot:1834207-Prymnesium_polylepis.2
MEAVRAALGSHRRSSAAQDGARGAAKGGDAAVPAAAPLCEALQRSAALQSRRLSADAEEQRHAERQRRASVLEEWVGEDDDRC